MYDEIERAVGGTPRRGMSVLGWIAVAFVGFSLLGVAGAVVGFLAVREEVREVREVVQRDAATLMATGVSDAVAGAVAGAEHPRRRRDGSSSGTSSRPSWMRRTSRTSSKGRSSSGPTRAT